MANPNVFILAADNSPKLLPLLRSNPSLASSQDANGYSLFHAAASYNHLELLRTLGNEFQLDPNNIKDEDGETALFVVETVKAAQVLLEELKADPSIRNAEGRTAEEKIQTEGDFVTIAEFLKESRTKGAATVGDAAPSNLPDHRGGHPPPMPPNVKVRLGTVEDEQPVGDSAEPDPVFRQRIEELAAREDFRGREGQRQLRELITDAVRGVGESERDVRQRVE